MAFNDWNAFLQNAATPTAATSSGSPAPAEALPQHTPDNTPSGTASYLAPYMAQAHQIFGRNPVFGDADFGKTPLGAGITSAVLAGTQARAGSTIGDSIGVASRMLVAPGQYQRQVALDEANYVNQKSQQQASLQDTLSQIRLRNAQGVEAQQRGNYYDGAATDYKEAQVAKLGLGQLPKTMTSDAGNEWAIDPTGKGTKQISGNPESGQPSFFRSLKQVKNAQAQNVLGGGAFGKAYAIANPPPDDPTKMADWGKGALQAIQDQAINEAGGRAGAVQAATQPQKDIDDFRTQQEFLYRRDVEDTKPLPMEQWEMSLTGGFPKDLAKARQDYEDTFNQKRKDLDSQFSNYLGSGAYRKGQSWADYQANKPAPVAAPSTQAKGAPNTKWTPPK